MRLPMSPPVPRRRQAGAIAITVALSLVFLLAAAGVAIDFGRLFVIRTELQSALDSCALSAARELDGSDTAIVRAQSAGPSAGNAQALNFQSASWADRPKLSSASLRFFDRQYNPTTSPAQARYARCEHAHASAGTWLLQVMNVWSPAQAPRDLAQVGAFAVATRGSAQSSCPVPLALRAAAGASAPLWGLVPGQWVSLLSKRGVPAPGQIGWANLDGSTNAAETEREMRGHCGSRVGDQLGTPGVQMGIADAWNERFGIYKNGVSASPTHAPDFTGYAYTFNNWPSGKNAYQGPRPASAPAGAQPYVAKAKVFASCGDTSTRVSDCEAITGLKLGGGFKSLAQPGVFPPGQGEGHSEFGAQRRIVTVPVVNATGKVQDYVCMLMLQPLSTPLVDVQLEFIGNAGAADSPCTTIGLPGGVGGPLVPVLVR